MYFLIPMYFNGLSTIIVGDTKTKGGDGEAVNKHRV